MPHRLERLATPVLYAVAIAAAVSLLTIPQAAAARDEVPERNILIGCRGECGPGDLCCPAD